MAGNTLDRPNYSKARREARKLLEELGIDSAPVNPVEIAKELGMDVWFVKFKGKNAGVSGYYDCVDDSIYVNKEEYPPRQTFTIAHEIGHKVLHEDWANSEDYKVLWRDTDGQEQDAREKEANTFAAALLMPKFLLDEYVDRLSPARLAELFAVSVPAMKNRLSYLYGI